MADIQKELRLLRNRVNSLNTKVITLEAQLDAVTSGNTGGETPATYDADTIAFTNMVQAQSTALSTAQKNSVDKLVLSLKSANIWSKMTAIYPMIGGSAASHKLNLVNPLDADSAYRLTYSGSLTHSATGMHLDGIHYANTHFNPASDSLYSTSHHMSFYSRSNTQEGQYSVVIGSQGINEDTSYMGARAASNTFVENPKGYLIDVNTGVASAGLTTGFYLATRTSDASLKLFRESTLIGSNTNSSTGVEPTNQPYYLGGLNLSGSLTFADNKEIAFVSMGYGLNDADSTAFFLAVKQFQIDNNRYI